MDRRQGGGPSGQSLTCKTAELREKLGDTEARQRAMLAECQKDCTLDHTAMEVELRELWKVAEVSRKWEEREARLARRLDGEHRTHQQPRLCQGGAVCK